MSVLLFVLAVLTTYVRASNILLLPLPATSHCLEVTAVGSELANRGHNVTILLPSIYDASRCLGDKKITLMVHPCSEQLVAFKSEMDKFMSDVFSGEYKLLRTLSHTGKIIGQLCHSYLTNEAMLTQLSETGFDIAIVDGFPFGRCLFALPYLIDVPTVSVSAVHDGFDCNLPFQANTFPHLITTFSNRMTFLERVMNSFVTLFMSLFPTFVISEFNLQSYGPKFENTTVREIFKASFLHLENADHIIDFPKAKNPNFIQVGGLTVTKTKPLPPDLEKYFDESTHGFILVSFGDVVKGANREFVEKLISAFSRLKENVLLKLEHDEIVKNVRIVKWMPQRDILAHPKLKLIVSHCGKNTFYEALYHAVPILCTPLHADNFAIAMRVKHFGVGTSLDIVSATPDEIVDSVTSALQNKSYASNMKKASLLFRDRTGSPRERAADAVEHVLKFGADHLKPEQDNLNIFQYAYGDIWLTIFSVLGIVLYVFVKIALILLRCVKGSSKKKLKRQ